MKKSYETTCILLLLFVLIISRSSARLIPSLQESSPVKISNDISLQQADNISSLVGVEECGDRDEDCDKRRIVAEAHLDYIYTQNHKP